MTAVRPDVIPNRRRYDAIVIGSGSGGLTVAVGLGRFGRQVLMIERDRMGGDCTNTGCIPSKTLLHEAKAFSAGRTDDPVDILARVRARRDAFRDHEVQEYGGAQGVTFVHGHGTLDPDRSVSITHGNGTVWQAGADHIVLATGSSPRCVTVPGLAGKGTGGVVLTTDELFDLSTPPDHLAILGGGSIGLEMATAFRRLGSSVTVVEAEDQLLPGVLPEAARIITDALAGQGVSIRTGVQATGYRADGGRLDVAPTAAAAATNGGAATVDGVDHVLLAVGRTPNTAGLGLAALGVELDERGAVVIDGRGRTSTSGVWAVGDMTNKGGSTHQASIWGRRIIQSILHPRLPVGGEPLRPTVTFTDPEVASIGEQPIDPPDDVIRVIVDGSAIDRSYTDSVDRSVLAVDVRPPTGDVLGATIVGPRAGEVITTFSLAMKTGIGFHRWYGTVIPYPTYSEVITRAVEQYLSEVTTDVRGHTTRWATGLWERARSRISGT